MSLRPIGGEVVFSGRLYQRTGRSFAQVLAVDPVSPRPVRVSSTPRHHRAPFCSRDGHTLWFLVPASDSEDWPNRELWRLDRRTGAETLLDRLPFAKTLDEHWRRSFPAFESILGEAAGGALLVFRAEEPGGAVYRYHGRMERLVRACEASLSPDGTRLAYRGCTGPEWVLADAAGRRVAGLGACGSVAWLPAGRQVACADAAGIHTADARTGRALRTVPFGGPARGACFAWSPDGARLLCRTTGALTNSTSPYWDYWLFDLAAGAWRALPEGGNQAVWADATHIVYTAPRELSPLGGTPRGVWTSHLKSVELPAMTVRALTADLELDRDPASCPAPSR